MNGMLAFHAAGEELNALPQRVLWWPAARTLAVADVHLGKAAAFRGLGVPIPEGTETEDLERLGRLLAALQPAELIVVGDLLHSPRGNSPALAENLRCWRARFPSVAVTLVSGNHDRKAEAFLAAAGIERIADFLQRGPLCFVHDSARTPSGAGFAIAGHRHPVVKLRERSGAWLRLPCFIVDRGCLILPAFGSFTGGELFHPEEGRRILLCGSDRVLALSP